MKLSEKQVYSRPLMSVERFVPQSYCDVCFTATGMLQCTINDGVEHGYPCAHTRFTIQYDNGDLSGTAEELNSNGTVKTRMSISDIDVPCGWANIEEWKNIGCSGCTWSNTDSNNHHYDHRGRLTISSYSWTKEGHPNHS